MGIDPQAVALAKRFEPILVFHTDEKYFPIDPKFYLERCALWRSKPHVRNFFPGGAAAEKQDWGEPPPTATPRMPKLAKGAIAALKSEVSGGKTWIGDATLGAVIPEPPTERPPTEDWFLQLTGWDPFVTAPGEVTAGTDNHRPTLTTNLYDGALQGGHHWYYAEYLTNPQLLALVRNHPDLLAVVTDHRLTQPRLLIYHYFYALHEEALQGCEQAGEGQTFATYAGEWSSVALLLNNSPPTPNAPPTPEPLLVGLTSRNVGDPFTIPSEENRIGMTAFAWKDVNPVGDHPKIFVSRGTHGNYLTPGLHPLQPFTPGDIDLNQGTCGQIETLDDVIAGGFEQTTDGDDPGVSYNVVWGSLAVNVLLAWVLAMDDVFDAGSFGADIPAIDPNRSPQDDTGGPNFGLILRPENLFVPELAAALKKPEDWQTKMPAPTDKPRFDFIVDRETQLWWPPRDASPGFAGRWGPRVTNDPQQRRSGMRCPPFALLFLQSLARHPTLLGP